MGIVTQKESSARDVDNRPYDEVIATLEARIEVLVQENRKLQEYIREMRELAIDYKMRVHG